MKQDKYRLNVVLLLITLALLAPRAGAADKYWIATSAANWNNTANWSLSSGGTGSAGVPGAGDVAIFDGTGGANGDCNIDAAVNVTGTGGINIGSGYGGTITQGAVTITVGSTGWTQAGGTFTGSASAITLKGPWSLSGGTFNAGNQTIAVNPAAGSWTYSGGTFNAGSSTVSFQPNNSEITISGSQTFNNLTLNGVFATHWTTITIPAATTLTVTGNLRLDDGGPGNAGVTFAGTGTIAAQGDITATCNRAGNAYFGPITLLINGAGDQTFTNGGAWLPSVTINKSGTLNLVGTFGVLGSHNYMIYWTLTAGTINAGTSRFNILGECQATVWSGSWDLYDVYFYEQYFSHGNTTTINAGSKISSSGTMGFLTPNAWQDIIIDTGTLEIKGNLDLPVTRRVRGTAVVNFTGTAAQQISYTASGLGSFEFSPITINKPSGTVTLATDLSLGTAGQQLVWTNGAVNLSSNTLTVAGAVTINPGATTLGVTVTDTNRAGRLMCGSAVSNIANVELEVTVAAAKAQSAQLQGQTYTILSNNASFGSATFESETWVGAWRGSVAYTNNSGKTVTLSNVRFVDGGTLLRVQ